MRYGHDFRVIAGWVRYLGLLPLSLLVLAAGSSSATAEVPESISYLAEVTLSGSGAPYTGPIDVEIALFPSANAPTPVWGPVNLGTLTVENGALQFLIGGPGFPPLDDALADWEVWLELNFDGQPLSPRQQVVAAPYARLAANSERLGGVEAAEYAQTSDLAPVASTGSYADLSDGSQLALISDLAEIAFTGDVASLLGDPAASILADFFVRLGGDTMQGDLDFDFHRLLNPRVMAAATEPAPCTAATLGLMYLDTGLDELRVCGVSGWVSGGSGGGSGPLPTQFSATQSPVAINQLAVPGACEPVSFTNYAGTPASGFGAPQVAGTYTASGCPATTCVGTLAPGATCEVFVRGAAVVSGPISGSVTVTASSGGTAVAVVLGSATLSGGAEIAALLSPVLVDQNGLPGECVEVLVTNVGSVPATGFSPPVVSGPYTLAGCTETDCTGTLAAGSTCSIYVRGNATASGPLAGSASITASVGGTAVAALTGTATLSLGRRMAISHGNAPYVSVYDADSAPFVKLPNVTPLPGNNGAGVAFSADGTRMAVAHTASPFFSVYNMESAPFARLSSPTALPTNAATSVAFSPDANRLAVTQISSPYLVTYDTTTTPYTKLTAPGILPPSTARAAAFSPDGTRLAVAHTNYPCFTVYQTTVVPFAKLDDPISPISPSTATCYSVAYSPDGALLVVGIASSPYLAVYDTTTLPYTKLSLPPTGTAPNTVVWSTAFSPDGRYLAVGQNSTPFLIVYDTSTTPWTRLQNPVSLPTGSVRGLAFSPDGDWLGVAHTGSTFAFVYDASSIPFTKVISPNVPPSAAGYGVAFAPAPQ